MITPKLLRDWGACWTDWQIKDAFAGRESVTPRDIANAPDVDDDDKLWVLCRTIWHLDDSAASLFAIESASLVTHLAGDEYDQAQHAGLINDLIQIEDLPVEKRAAARAAAWAAARYAAKAACDAARAAACDAARAAAWDAAWDAALDAARAAAWDAAWDAALDAARAAARAAFDAAWAAAKAAWDAAKAAAARAAFDAARAAVIKHSIARALEWLGDYADGWEES